jgi:4-hydroxybenzoate polyprenyltransferase
MANPESVFYSWLAILMDPETSRAPVLSALPNRENIMLLTAQSSQRTAIANQTPLCVDLDGTLIAGDLLWESVFALLRQNFLFVFLLPLWLCKGKACLKEQIASRVHLDPQTLPYRADVLKFLREQKEEGRYLVLATASSFRLVKPIADHLDLFDEVIASNPSRNLKGRAKLEQLQTRFEETGFDYIGDSPADIPIWQNSQAAYVVQPSRRLLKQIHVHCVPKHVFRTPEKTLRPLVKLMRPHQWVKNLLLFVPLILAHQFLNFGSWALVSLGFAAFCLSASAVYVLNDLLDLQADRQHPNKRRRPLASGAISIPTGMVLFVGLFLGGFTLALIHSWQFAGVLALYLVVTTAYSFYLKKKPIMDVFVLAGLYTLRILAGGIAAGVLVTGWLMAFSIFFFISLALVKRYSELARLASENHDQMDHRGYLIEDLGMIQSVGPASGYMAVLTMCLYINAHDVLKLYSDPQLLWVICLVLFYWITRIWFLARRRKLHEDPVVFAATDPVSYFSGAIILAALWFAAA